MTESDITKIEEVFGFKLFEWQKDYLLGKTIRITGGRKVGRMFIISVKMLLDPHHEKFKIDDIQLAIKPKVNAYLIKDLKHVNDRLIAGGFSTNLITE